MGGWQEKVYSMKKTVSAAILQAIYARYETHVSGLELACSKGCATCCTQSVTITALEGETILGYIDRNRTAGARQEMLLKKLREAAPARPLYTTNQLAAYYLAGREPERTEKPWVIKPCVFLDQNRCAIYPARPFNCRSFASAIRCDSEGTAELPAAVISLNTAILQVIEHLDQGNHWGNMIDILQSLVATGGAGAGDTAGLLTAQRNPGFLVPPEDQRVVSTYLKELYGTSIQDKTVGHWLQCCGEQSNDRQP